MLLVGYSWFSIVTGVLYVSLTVLAIVIGYRYLLRRLGRGAVDKANYCELYSLEVSPASGELPFYFTSEKARHFTLSILDANMEHLQDIVSKQCKPGGNIVRFDSTQLPNGDYFYCLRTDNQKTVKKMKVVNT